MAITVAVERICMSTRTCPENVCCWDSKTSMGSALWHRLSMAHGDIALWGHPFWESLFWSMVLKHTDFLLRLLSYSPWCSWVCHTNNDESTSIFRKTQLSPANWQWSCGPERNITQRPQVDLLYLSSDIPTCSLNIYSRLFAWLFSHLGVEEHILNPSFWWSQLMFVDYDAMWLRLSK